MLDDKDFIRSSKDTILESAYGAYDDEYDDTYDHLFEGGGQNEPETEGEDDTATGQPKQKPVNTVSLLLQHRTLSDAGRM